jgi:zinc transporter ZupT
MYSDRKASRRQREPKPHNTATNSKNQNHEDQEIDLLSIPSNTESSKGVTASTSVPVEELESTTTNSRTHDHKDQETNTLSEPFGMKDCEEKTCEGHSRKHGNHKDGCCDNSAILEATSAVGAISLLVGISSHSLFEGLPMNSLDSLRPFVAGLVLHKLVESAAFASTLFSTKFSSTTKWVIVFVYSLLTPAGTVFGYMLSSFFEATVPWLFAMCFGTLLYVIFIEVFPNVICSERRTSYERVILISSVFGGIVIGTIASSHIKLSELVNWSQHNK